VALSTLVVDVQEIFSWSGIETGIPLLLWG
jgi:hypothetical protein